VPDLDTVAQSLARNLKRVRQELGYSLDALAARSGVSRGMIIQIEQARTNPSIGTVVRLGDALGLSVGRLLEHTGGARVRMVAPQEAIRLWQTPAGSHGTLRIGTEAPGPLELWSWRLMPGEDHASDPHPAGTAELLRVESGELTLVVDGEDHRVPAGTAASFEADLPHAYRNEAAEPVEFTLVVSVPPPR
jgi:transcriptional regulator with XRE-family HTH domain